MPELNNFFIQSQLDPSCNIEVTDITDYPWGAFARDEVALFFFYDKNGLTIDIDGAIDSNANQYNQQMTFTIVPVNGYTYSIRCYVVPIWAAGIYAAGSIVWDDATNAFYYSAGGATAVQAPSIIGTIAWILIDISTQALKNTYWTRFGTADTGGLLHGYVDETIDVICEDYTLVKTSCNHYTLTDYTGDNITKTVTIWSYELQAYLPTTYTLSSTDDDIDIDLSAYGDGAYQVIISDVSDTVNAVRTTMIIYEWCSIWSCYQSIFQALVCGVYNPCCNTCDLDTIRQNEKYREQLNIMTGFMLSILAYSNNEIAPNLGIFTVTDGCGNSGDYINRVSDYIIKAKDLIATCGWCNASDVDSDTNPCINCD